MTVYVPVDEFAILDACSEAQLVTLISEMTVRLHPKHLQEAVRLIAGNDGMKLLVSEVIDGQDYFARLEVIKTLADRFPQEFRAAGLAQVETA